MHNLGVSLVLITSIIFPVGKKCRKNSDVKHDTKIFKDSDLEKSNEKVNADQRVFSSEEWANKTTVGAEIYLPPPNSIGMFASRRREKSVKPDQQQQLPMQSGPEIDNTDEQYILYTPKLPGQFTGTGDVCAALFLGWTAEMEVEELNFQEKLDYKEKNGKSFLGDSLEKLAGECYWLCVIILTSAPVLWFDVYALQLVV